MSEGGDRKEVHGLLILFLHYELQPERLKFTSTETETARSSIILATQRLQSCSAGWRAGQCSVLFPLMPCPLIFPVTTAPHRNPHNLCRGVLLGTPHFKGAYLLLEIQRKCSCGCILQPQSMTGLVLLTPPLLANKVLLRLGGFPESLMGLVQTSTQVCFHSLFSKIDFFLEKYLSCFSKVPQ